MNFHRKDAECAEELMFHLPLRGRQMKIANHFVIEIISHFFKDVRNFLSANLPAGLVIFHFLASHQKVKRKINFASSASRAKRAVI